MKQSEKIRAIELRKTGLSLSKISSELKVSKSIVSTWTRDVILSKEQIEKLYRPQGKNTEFFKNSRKQYQEEGMEKAKEKDINHAIGCMLYWAERTKSRNQLSFTNSDITVHKTFLDFLRKYYKVDNNRISIHINCYLDHGITIEEIYKYWVDSLGLEGCKINKATVRDPMRSSFSNGQKKSRLKYGVMRLSVGESRIIQNIYGAIQEYCGFINESWLTK